LLLVIDVDLIPFPELGLALTGDFPFGGIFRIFFFSPRFCKLFLHHFGVTHPLACLAGALSLALRLQRGSHNFLQGQHLLFEVVMPIPLLLFHPDVTAGILRHSIALRISRNNSLGIATSGI